MQVGQSSTGSSSPASGSSAAIVATRTPPSTATTVQTLPAPTAASGPPPTTSAVDSSIATPPEVSPASVAAIRRASVPPLRGVHVDRDVDEAKTLREGHLVELLRRILRADGNASDAPSADQGRRRRDRRAGREAEIGHAALDGPADARCGRCERGEVVRGEAAADHDPVDALDPRRVEHSALGERDDLAVDGAGGAEGVDQLLGVRRGILAHGDDDDARGSAVDGRAPRGLGHERAEHRGIRVRGEAPADEMDAHAALPVTGGSADQGNRIHRSVRRQT